MQNNCCNEKQNIKQSQTNTQIIVPVQARTEYELALESGLIPSDTTLQEWLNRNTNNTNNILEFGDNV